MFLRFSITLSIYPFSAQNPFKIKRLYFMNYKFGRLVNFSSIKSIYSEYMYVVFRICSYCVRIRFQLQRSFKVLSVVWTYHLGLGIFSSIFLWLVLSDWALVPPLNFVDTPKSHHQHRL